MTASGPFAMGPALAGTSARRSTPRSNFAPIVPTGTGTTPSAIGPGSSRSAAPSLKQEQDAEQQQILSGGASKDADAEMYSDPDEGVEIVDMENIRQMDWMAPESLRKERTQADKRRNRRKREKPEGKCKCA